MDYPKFYEVDGILVVITEEDEELFGRSLPFGKPYPAFKAINEGEELGRDEFLDLLKQRYPDTKMAAFL